MKILKTRIFFCAIIYVYAGNIMRKHLLIISSLLLTSSIALGTALITSLQNDIQEATADTNELEPSCLGDFYTYERVHDHYKVVIPFSRKAFIEAAGRTVHMEMVSGGGLTPIDPYFPIGPLNNGTPIEPNSFDHLVPQYYYWAETNDGILLNRITLYNNLSSLEVVLDQLSRDTDFYLDNYYDGDLDDDDEYLYVKNNLILGYLRTINPDYSSLFWDLAAGEENNEFKTYINSINTSSNVELYNISRYLEPFHGSLGFIDPLDNTQILDLIHMFASIDGTILGTDRSLAFGLSNNVNYVRHASSWGADLQTACKNITSDTETMEDIFSDTSSEFTWDDFISDIYAVNIGANFNSYYDDFISDFSAYFENESLSNRITNMFLRMADISQIDYEHLHHLHSTIYDMVALSSDGNFNTCGTSDEDYIKYFHLRPGILSPLPSVQTRKKVADLFYNYLINNC